MNWQPFTLIPTLLRPLRAVIHAPPVIQTPIAGPAGSEVHLGKPAGFDQVTSKMDRPATYSRRNGAQRSLAWKSPGWCWGTGGRLKMRTVQLPEREARVIQVIPVAHGLSAHDARQFWRPLAITASGRSPFKNLFARNAR